MKKFFIAGLIMMVALLGISCASTAPASGAVIEGEVTQEKVDAALEQIYDSYRTHLDLTGAQDYTVVSGDTLSQITRRFYGSATDVGDAGAHNGFYFPVIMMASDSDIVDPDLIEPGMQLKIPELRRNLDNPTARQAIKDSLNEVSYVYNRKGKAAEEAGLIKLADSL